VRYDEQVAGPEQVDYDGRLHHHILAMSKFETKNNDETVSFRARFASRASSSRQASEDRAIIVIR
jgi:hypothetical protein